MGYKLEAWFLRSSSPGALASFVAILGQELEQCQAKNQEDQDFNTERTENAENNVLHGLRASVSSVVSVFQFSWVFWL